MMRTQGVFGEAFQASSNFQTFSVREVRTLSSVGYRIVCAARLFRGHLASNFSISLFLRELKDVLILFKKKKKRRINYLIFENFICSGFEKKKKS